MFILWNGKILRRKRGSLPLNSTHLLPHFSSKALVHPLPCHGSLQCSIHHCRRKEDPTVERGTTCQGHVVYFGRIDRPREGLRCYEEGHWRSQRAIGKMVCGSWRSHHQCAKVPLVPEVVECTRLVLFPLIQRSGRSTDRSCQHALLRGSSLRGR
jgi:hypothetical protein